MNVPASATPASDAPEPLAAEPLVAVDRLSVEFPGEAGPVRAVRELSFTLPPGGALGIVGESGSGKSTAAYALLGLHHGTGARLTGSVRVAGQDVAGAGEAELRRLRGATAAMVFQDPLSSLDPYQAVGDQIAEVYRVHHRDASRRAARARAVETLDRVGIPDAARRARSRPHEFSGGQRQRALIAMAVACGPRLLVADEPTTALDVTVQAQILALLRELREETGMGLVLVTHDLGVAAGSVDELLVMKDGRAVEHGPVRAVLDAPREPYTRALLDAVPRVDVRRAPVVVPGVSAGSGVATGPGGVDGSGVAVVDEGD
ncbi:ABC transporter ATP-binding protein, partial [Streptomyces sp. URMC 126]|uniref:ABC transporter ATP-binding protein n=1 Tax=Streptomyces sp. URMC 126 TaxID=3423401 RepID=UPI003F19317D